MYRRTVEGKVLDFGTTGLLRFSNLVMYDRQTESWWQEFGGQAIVGEMTGKKLELLPMNIVSWKEFKEAHPKGKVLSRDTGYRRPYGDNPYIQYDSQSPFMYSGPQDRRLKALDRIVGISLGAEALVIPYSVLEKNGVAQVQLDGQDLVVFYKKGTASALDSGYIAEGRDVGAATVYQRVLEGRKLTFRAEADQFVDEETGSTWTLLGEAKSGQLAGKRLAPVAHQNSFWFAWVAFRPQTAVYKP